MTPPQSLIAEPGVRLDRFLVEKFPGTSRQYWREHLTRLVRVNGKVPKKGLVLAGGETLEILATPASGPFALSPNADVNLSILLEDPDFLAVLKPAGIPCHPLRPEETETVANGLLARYPELKNVGPEREAGLVHRLDNETSGVLLVARNAETHALLTAANRAGALSKYYLALVHGNLQGHGVWEEGIRHHPKSQARMCVASEEEMDKAAGREALTAYRAVRSQDEMSLILARIHVGQRHQIRVHCAHHGHPIVGDKLYGNQETSPRHLLHALSIHLDHPRSGDRLRIAAPIPADFFPG